MPYLQFVRYTIFLNTHTFSRWKGTLRKIEKLLIANRGEIACRVMKTAKKLGVRTVAVYSDADENALHVALADEAYRIGPPPAAQSYLRGDEILKIAHAADCQAIHPGYGFLSENVEFAESCQANNIIFIGPPPTAIRNMGIKSTSKAIMSKAGVPIVEGYHGDDQSNEKLINEARRIGFPVMIKAVRGGGGKGMRIAYVEENFEAALESARTESQKAFGDSVVLLEKFVSEPRHVEVQVFSDTHGNTVHLYERDCSVQRRHQKIIEEAPAPGLSTMLREELGATAVRAAQAVGYIGAGTVEFILDKNTHSFYFMEMNTRLQVEHPITEMITGTDLVEWQIKIASGEKLPFTQDQIVPKGHAFEARIYAEDCRANFLPGAGPLLHLSTPTTSDDTRIETGVREGDEVSVYYDPMIAKLVVWGNDRSEALLKLEARLLEYNITGLETNVNFLLDLSRHTNFFFGKVHTNFIRDHYNDLFRDDTPTVVQICQAVLAIILIDRTKQEEAAIFNNDQYNPFVFEFEFRVNYQYTRKIQLKFKDREIPVTVKKISEQEYNISCDYATTSQVIKGNIEITHNKHILSCCIDEAQYKCNIFKDETSVTLFDHNGKTTFLLPQSSFLEQAGESASALQNKATAPMPGVIDKILVQPGDVIHKGDPLFVLIAMKMEYIVKASRDAEIESVLCKVGDFVEKDSRVVQYHSKE